MLLMSFPRLEREKLKLKKTREEREKREKQQRECVEVLKKPVHLMDKINN